MQKVGYYLFFWKYNVKNFGVRRFL
jgi:hypothetical protein